MSSCGFPGRQDAALHGRRGHLPLQTYENAEDDGIFVGGFVIGTIVTGWWYSRVLSRQISSREIDFAFQAAEKAEWLAQLRLNQPEIAIKQLEKSMDIQVFTLAQWEEVNTLKAEIRERRDRFLVPVKVYHESYPPGGEEANVISAFLKTVPGRDLKKFCKSGVCRLDDLRRASPPPSTNAVTN